MRSVTGTSPDGTETSFIDAGFEDLNFDRINQLETTRVLGSRINESNRLGSLPRNKSFTFTVELANSGDEYNSPTVNLEGANALFYENRLTNRLKIIVLILESSLDSTILMLLTICQPDLY